MQIIILWEGYEDPVVLEVPEDCDTELFVQLLVAETGRKIDNHFLEFEGQRLALGHPLIYQGVLDGSTIFVKPALSSASSSAKQSTPSQPIHPSVPTNIHPSVHPASHSSSSPVPSSTPSGPPAASGTLSLPVSLVLIPLLSFSFPAGNNRNMTIYDLPANVTPEQLMDFAQPDSQLLKQIQANDTELAAPLTSRDLPKLRMLMMKRFMNRHKEEYTRQQEFMELEKDPMNPELQKRIEEEVKSLSLSFFSLSYFLVFFSSPSSLTAIG
jgi:hypothetical protein